MIRPGTDDGWLTDDATSIAVVPPLPRPGNSTVEIPRADLDALRALCRPAHTRLVRR